VGYNYRMTNVAAAIGCGQIECIEQHLARRQQVARWYFQHLNPHRSWFWLPDQAADCHHCYWMYSLVLRDELELSRDDVMEQLAEQGIETRPVFYPVHWMPPYQEPRGGYPVAEAFASRGISLPTHGRLTEDDVAFVCRTLIETVAAHAEVPGRGDAARRQAA
jgi:perosamine synthetase